MNEILSPIFNWIRQDWHSNRIRFVLEVTAWVMSLGCTIAVAVYAPSMGPIMAVLYPLFIIQCGIYAWAAWSRQSFGMLANYMVITTIDTIGFIRIML